jgi:deazaflavin-dependent oxidoreductase (nitroreductase family)
MPKLDASTAAQAFCYLTTTGRVTGKPHTIEIWFGLQRDTLYLMSGGRDKSDWVRNIMRNPEVSMRIGEQTYGARGRAIEPGTEEDALARRLLVEKYSPTHSGDLTNWGRDSLPVALDLANGSYA